MLVQHIRGKKGFIDNYKAAPQRGHDPKIFSDGTEYPMSTRLSPKEMQVAVLVSQGERNQDIALTLGTTEQVIKNCLRSVYQKTGIADRLELTMRMTREGMLPTHPELPTLVITPDAPVDPVLCQVHGSLMVCPTCSRNHITPRQLEVLKLLLDGRSNREMAQVMNIETRTIKSHMARLMHRAGVKNRILLARHVQKHPGAYIALQEEEPATEVQPAIV